MLNEPPKQKPSESRKQSPVTLRIPAVTPTVTLTLLLTALLIGLAHFSDLAADDAVLATIGLLGTAVRDGGQLYRLFTTLILLPTPSQAGLNAALLGGGYMAFCLYALYIVGMPMERLFGNGRTLVIVVFGGVLGSVVTLLTVLLGLMTADAVTVGLPGVVLALAGAEWVYLYKHRYLYNKFGQQRQFFLIGVATLTVVFGAFAPRVDLFGMLGALVGGTLLALAISPYLLPQPAADDKSVLVAEDINPLAAQVPVLLGYSAVLALLVSLFVFLPS
jgi:rhomboid protease GluP